MNTEIVSAGKLALEISITIALAWCIALKKVPSKISKRAKTLFFIYYTAKNAVLFKLSKKNIILSTTEKVFIYFGKGTANR